MDLLSPLKFLEKIIIGSILLGFLVLFGVWQWEARTARSVLDNSVQLLQQGHVSGQYKLTLADIQAKHIPDKPYSIVYQDQHFFWGRWYCVSFAGDVDLIFEIIPALLSKHEVNIKRVSSCRNGS